MLCSRFNEINKQIITLFFCYMVSSFKFIIVSLKMNVYQIILNVGYSIDLFWIYIYFF